MKFHFCSFVLIIIILITIGINTFVWAENGTLFVKKCGACHRKDGKAPPINPADKAALVWKRYFKRKRHPIDLSNIITPNELQQILTYLQEHAADSDQPEAAVIPK